MHYCRFARVCDEFGRRSPVRKVIISRMTGFQPLTMGLRHALGPWSRGGSESGPLLDE